MIPDESLDEIAEEIENFQEHDDDNFIDDLLTLGGSSAGASPKILVNLDGEDWLVKFRSSMDEKDIGNIEYAYHLMAAEAGLELPSAKLFSSKKEGKFPKCYFGVKRFDRAGGKRIHMHTIAGLLHADHRQPCLDYEMLRKQLCLLLVI